LNRHGTYLHQGGLQLAATFVSVGLGIAFGIAAGFILNLFYNENPNDFFEDRAYINVEENEALSDSGPSQQITGND
jgi:hypothetical protein